MAILLLIEDPDAQFARPCTRRTMPHTTVIQLRFAEEQWFWAFRQMGLLGRSFRDARGLGFHRLMGVGRRFAGIDPDWSRYVLMTVWRDEADAANFLRGHPGFARYRERATGSAVFHLTATRVTGTWDGTNPFGPASAEPKGEVAVLTRATLRLRRQLAFWRATEAVVPELDAAPGLVRALPIGELPVLRSGTFSLWESAAAVAAFGRRPNHSAAVRARAQQGFYAEELFARFEVLGREERGDV